MEEDTWSTGNVLLPELSDQPFLHPHCCLSLSTSVLKTIADQLPRNRLILSIGCGSGLLEGLLQKEDPELQIEGVEVNQSVIQYLREEQSIIVRGTWAISSRADAATTLLFVYPRNTQLVQRYLKSLEQSKLLLSIIFIGPLADVAEFMPVFSGLRQSFQVIESSLGDFEAMRTIQLNR
jgi:hypothetical protein